MYKFSKSAFTLAELLIAMAIFGFIAVTLVPNVTNNAERSLFTTQVKKVQNDIQQAILLIITKNQGSLSFVCNDPAGNTHACFRDMIASSLDVFTVFGKNTTDRPDIIYNYSSSDSGPSVKKDIADPVKQKTAYQKRTPIFLNGSQASFPVNYKSSYEAANLKNGAMVSVYFDPACPTDEIVAGVAGATLITYGTSPVVCGYLEVDVNATKAPNVVGKDIHYFWIVDKDGLVPFGEIDDLTCGVLPEAGKTGVYTRPEKSNVAKTNLGCTYRLMSRGKIDYY